MKKFFTKLVSLLLLFIILLQILPSAPAAHAQQATTTTLIPPSFELFANPGDSLSEALRIRNEGTTPITYNTSSLNFEADGDSGQVQLTTGETSKSFSLASWITPSIRFIVIPGHTERSIPFIIKVPQNAEPGGHYGALQIATASGGNVSGGASVAAGQVSLILLRVSGNVSEKAIVKSFTVAPYSEYGPVKTILDVKNEGAVHIKPTGTIVISDLFGAKVAEFPLDGKNALPGALRKMETTWSEKNPIGRFKAQLVAQYGEKHEPLIAETYFIVFPKPLAIGIGVTMIILVILIAFLIAGRKRIAKAFRVIAQG